jgi:1,5-anhydro-D-fructose reductase (1,5-anhydro-D-mannitol-forming)
MAPPLGWGFIGFGWVARDYMAPAVREAGDRLLAISDPDPAAQEAAVRLGIPARSEAELLSDPTIEAVYVATPNHLHADIVERAAKAGKAVLCEKPMAATLEQAERMAEACRRSGILYGTAFDQRHHPAHRAMREAIGAGRIGRPTLVRITYACWVGPDWSAADARDNWRVDPVKAGGGALMDLAPHGLDLVEFLLGEPLVDVTAMTQSRIHDYAVDDGAVLLGRTAGGVLLALNVAYNCPEALPRRRLEVIGETGQLLAVDTMGQTPGGTVSLLDGVRGGSEPLVIPDGQSSPFLGQARAFAHAIRSGEHGIFSADRDLHTMRLLHRAYASAVR